MTAGHENRPGEEPDPQVGRQPDGFNQCLAAVIDRAYQRGFNDGYMKGLDFANEAVAKAFSKDTHPTTTLRVAGEASK